MESYQETFEGGHLSIVGQGLTEIPAGLAAKYGDSVTELDLTDNNIRNISNLNGFTSLKSLVLDHNALISKQEFPVIESLETLWVNSNNIESLEIFLDGIQNKFPKLNYLSMLKNPCCPNYFVGKDSNAYQKYRFHVLARIPGLKFLDASPITSQERTEANKIAQTIARPDQAQYGRVDEDNPVFDERLALPATDNSSKEPATFGIARYVYYGRQSEGNRFIVDSQL